MSLQVTQVGQNKIASLYKKTYLTKRNLKISNISVLLRDKEFKEGQIDKTWL